MNKRILDEKWHPGIAPCPNCGERAWLIKVLEGFLKVWRVRCSNPECQHDCECMLEERGALRLWNDRAA